MDFNFDILYNINNTSKPSKGKVLLAVPFLQGYYFSRSIVLLTEHDKNGSMGLVLNKPLDLNINQLLKEGTSLETILGNYKLCCGGPVSPDRLFYLHKFASIPGAVEIKDNLFLGGDFEVLQHIAGTMEHPEDYIRFFIGYSGWSPGQLKEEITDNSWVVQEMETDEILDIFQVNRL